jgi:DNA polymerase-3 subunit delta'
MTAPWSVLGHDQVKARLLTALERDRLSHALLIAGPEGVGKQRLAMGLAALLACEARPRDFDAICGECPGCRQVVAGSHPDLRVVGVPSHKKEIRIEPIRELRRFIQLAPLAARRKVVIITDAHALNPNAQNALLKTLEEPAPRSLLVLVTHAPGALLPTVRSRCQRVHCGPLSDQLAVAILEREQALSPADARLAVAYAEGSPGRALQLRGALGERRSSLLRQLAELADAGYVRTAQLIGDAADGDPVLPLTLMLTWYRDQAVRAVGAERVGLRNADLADAVPVANAASAIRRAEIVTDALTRLRRGNPNRQLLWEAVFLRLHGDA